jgi:hypothetical protein
LELLEKGKIQKHDTMKVSNPEPDDEDMERLIKIYTQIGFKHGESEAGNPVNLYSTIQNLIETLAVQCEITGGGKRHRKRTRKKRRTKKTKKKHKKNLKKKTPKNLKN